MPESEKPMPPEALEDKVSKEPKANISRRSFIKKSAMAAGAFGAGMLTGSFGSLERSPATAEKSQQQASAPSGSEEVESKEVPKEPAEREVSQAEELLRQGDPTKYLENRFLASALYYSDSFFDKLAEEEPQERHEPNSSILERIDKLITADIRRAYINALTKKAVEALGDEDSQKMVRPLEKLNFGHGSNHADAVDLFIREGDPVVAIMRGVVVLSESDWSPGDPLSTVSSKGGNSVIIFNPDRKEFYRYCHLEGVTVKTGEVVTAGFRIGTVGHTGFNASKPGRGNHLHLEVNKYAGDEMASLSSFEIKGLINRLAA